MGYASCVSNQVSLRDYLIQVYNSRLAPVHYLQK